VPVAANNRVRFIRAARSRYSGVRK
jgi:hypothetical protein